MAEESHVIAVVGAISEPVVDYGDCHAAGKINNVASDRSHRHSERAWENLTIGLRRPSYPNEERLPQEGRDPIGGGNISLFSFSALFHFIYSYLN